MKENENLTLALLALSKERREYAGDLYTIIQAGLMGKSQKYDGGALLESILPPGKNKMYKGGYCPPYDAEIIAALEKAFSFSLKESSGSDYMSVKIVRLSDGKNAIFELKMPVDFGSKEYQKELEDRKLELEKKIDRVRKKNI